MRRIQNLMDAIWQSYEYFRNQPQIQPVIVLNDCQPESVNASFTPQAIDQVNRAAALIDAYESKDSNDTKESWESDDTREDFIAFSSLLAVCLFAISTILFSLNLQMTLDSHVSSGLIVIEMMTPN